MSLIPYNDSFLLWQFRQFYAEVIRLKRLVKGSKWTSVMAPEPNGNGDDPTVGAGTLIYYPELERTAAGTPAVAGTSLAFPGATPWVSDVQIKQPTVSEQTRMSMLVWQSLLALFRGNAQQMLRFGGTHNDAYLEAQYVMAAFADEVFINLDWEGSQNWTSNLLEATLFKSHVAGERFFENLDRLLADRDPANKGLAAVYLNALSLGFKGKYRDLDDHGKLRTYRQKLFIFAFGQPTDLGGKTKVAFPDAYIQTLNHGVRKKLTNPRLWLVVFALVFLSYLGISHGVWLSLTSRLEQANGQVLEIENGLNAIPMTKR